MAALSLQHQAREQLHVIALLSRCLRIRSATAAESRRWRREIGTAKGRLQRLFAKGLDRRDLLAQIRAGARSDRTTTPAASVNALRRGLATSPLPHALVATVSAILNA